MINELSTTVAVLQSVVYKIDNTVAEIAKSSTEVTRLLAVHDSRLGNLEFGNKETSSDVRDLYKKMNEDTKEIVEKLEDMEERIELKLKEHSDKSIAQHKSISDRLSILENWKWMVIGSAMALGFLLNHLELFK
jgi:tetrahydromethanopterin S-methyltransferase subunit G